MAEYRLSPPTEADIPEIVDCWQRCFGDPPELIRGLLAAGALLSCATAAKQDGLLRSVMFAFDGLSIDGVPAAYLYALCTHPDTRGQGMGSAVLHALAESCFARGAELVFLSPADSGLAEWYCSMGMHRAAPWDTPAADAVGQSDAAPLSPIPPETYAALRRSPIVVPLRLLRAQELLSRSCGGGFYRTDCGTETAVFCAEPNGNRLLIRELCCASAYRPSVLRSAAAAFQRDVFCGGGSEIVYITKNAEFVPPACLSRFPFILD